MSIKLIAVDMDGTFLSDAKTYNRQRFLSQYRRMREQDIRFVVASGNQYYQLISFFPEVADEIAFVAENGGWVVNAGDDVFNCQMPKDHFHAVIDFLQTLPEIGIIACGKRSAYTLNRYNDELKAVAAKYYHRLELVDDFNNLDDAILKFGLNVPDNLIPEMQQKLHAALAEMVNAVATGYGSIDLIMPGVHKANGLRILQERWGIENHQVVAFGDSGNDIEMLQHAGFGYAMANAAAPVKAVAGYDAPHNNEEGVLHIIDKVLNREAPFA
ncbi:Cof-type HAD-IIB family hydrolase [Raoultella terrigena]|uniref:Cof-type HAD-IIB family hydrolase n=1 Tax=Raoultella terrigena TaxID=577 RepID=UPI003850ADE9